MDTITPFHLHAPKDARSLAEAGIAACGQCALAAALERDVATVRPYFRELWVSEKTMREAMQKMAVQWHESQDWTERCLVLIQGLGTWMNPGVPHGAKNQRTHWIAGSMHVEERMVYDVNIGDWVPKDAWEQIILPPLLKSWKAYGFEVRTIFSLAS